MPERESQYKKIVKYIKEEVADGHLKQGDKLPSEKALCQRFHLSRQTIRHATGELESEGIITRVRGSGSYVGKRQLASRPHYMSVAVMLTYVDNYIFPPVVRGISSALDQNGYSMQISFTDKSVLREEQILKNLIENDNIDALIAEPSKGALPNPNLKYYEILRERQIPVLFINAAYPGLECPCVRLDDEKIAYDAVMELVKRGHREIGGIFQCEDAQGIYRYMGYCQALKEVGIHVDPKRVIWLDTIAIQNITPLIGYIRDRLGDATAVLAYNDELASQLMKDLLGLGLHLPEDLSIISIDDADLAKNTQPALTTYPHPKEELGRRAGEKVIQMIQGSMEKEDELFDSHLIDRESVRDMRKGK